MSGAPEVVLGISCDYHDAAAALLVDGRIVAAAEEERFTRRRHDRSVPAAATESCLHIAGIDAADVGTVAFYEQPIGVVDRHLAAHRRSGPRGLWTFARDAPTLVGHNLMVDDRIERMLRRLGAPRSPRIVHLEHHVSHAASAFYPSPFDRAAILTVDGIGEWAAASIGRGHGHHLEVLEELRYPDSLGLLYAFVTAYCGFVPNDGEYKLMGLAAYGTPRFSGELRGLAGLDDDDGSLRVRAGALGWFSPGAVRRRSIERLFGGKARTAGEPLDQRHADIAASIQDVTEAAIFKMVEHAVDLTGERRLCLAGGVALNGVATGKLLRSGLVDDVWVQPAAGDAGSSLGAALAWWHGELGRPRPAPTDDAMRGAFLGPWAEHNDVAQWLRDTGVEFVEHGDDAELVQDVVGRLTSGQVVGWCQGRMEFGPRALGHRSILADPRSPTVRSRINDSVKQREGFRPFAPAVLEDRAPAWFELAGRSRFMSFAVPVVGERLVAVPEEPTGLAGRATVPRSEIPACTHVDGSARVQTVDAASNPEFHRLLVEFDRVTGCPILLNTSFNGPGEPIVASPADALGTGRAIGLDAVVIERCVIHLGPAT